MSFFKTIGRTESEVLFTQCWTVLYTAFTATYLYTFVSIRYSYFLSIYKENGRVYSQNNCSNMLLRRKCAINVTQTQNRSVHKCPDGTRNNLFTRTSMEHGFPSAPSSFPLRTELENDEKVSTSIGVSLSLLFMESQSVMGLRSLESLVF